MPGPRDLVIGTAGHIDHGKTALVRALTGVDTDRLPAEKQRGITIDLGFAALELEGRNLALVDVPGHERFIRNMLAGASGLDLAILVIAADDSVMPQTREHLEILRLMGLAGGLIVLTKTDLADEAWLNLVEDDARTLVAGTFLESAEIVRTSASRGLGISDLKAALVRLADQTPERSDPGLFRMAVDRSFTVAGHGTVVTGTVVSGEVAVGDELDWLPSGRSVRVRGLHRHDRAVDRVARGARAAINLVGVHHREIVRGHELATPGYLVGSKVVSVEVHQSPEAVRPLKHRGRYRVHIGTAEVAATLSILGGNDLGPSGQGLAQLHLLEPIATVHGQPFVIREESPAATLGGGRLLQPSARRIRRRDRPMIDRLERLGSADPSVRISTALGFQGLGGGSDRMLSRDSGVPIGEVGAVVNSLVNSGELVDLAVGPRRSVRVSSVMARELESRVLQALARLHEASPRFSSIARARVASSLADLENAGLISGVIDRLQASGRVVADSRTVALAGHEPRLSQAERKLKKTMLEAFQAGGCSPPDPVEWVTRTGPKSSAVADLLALLRDEEQLVEVAPGLYFDQEAERSIRQIVREKLAGGSGMTVADLRDWLGTSRKFAIPLAEYLDRVGLTRREGDLRFARETPAVLVGGSDLP